MKEGLRLDEPHLRRTHKRKTGTRAVANAWSDTLS